MPPSGILLYLLDKLYQDLITRLGLTIGMSIVWRWIEYFNLIKFGKIMYLLWNKRWTLIHCQSLRKTESVNNMLRYKLNYLPMCHSLQRNCFGLFSKLIRSNQHKTVSLWRRGINLTNEIQPQPLNVHNLIIGCNNAAGTNWTLPNCWHSSHSL